jgi:hypothetical protein
MKEQFENESPLWAKILAGFFGTVAAGGIIYGVFVIFTDKENDSNKDPTAPKTAQKTAPNNANTTASNTPQTTAPKTAQTTAPNTKTGGKRRTRRSHRRVRQTKRRV